MPSDSARDPKLRVLAYCDSLQYSGAEMYFVRICAALDGRADVEMTVASPVANVRLSAALEPHIAFRELRESPGQSHRLSAFHLLSPRERRTAGRALGGEFDVLFVNLSSAEHGGLPLMTKAGRGLPSAGLLHLHHSPTFSKARLGATRERLARLATRELDTICTLSSVAADQTRTRWADEHADVVAVPMPYPTVTRTEREAARAALGLTDKAPLVGYAGRLDFAQKGYDLFVEVARLLAERHPEARFAVAGDGPDARAGEAAATAAGIRSRFDLLGRIEDIGLFLSAIDVLVIPSRAEGLPLLALEALSLGTPGVATSVDGLVDSWPTSRQVASEDVEGMARLTSSLLQDPTSGVPPADTRDLLEANTAHDLGAVFHEVLLDTAQRHRSSRRRRG